MVFGAGFASMMANARGRNNGHDANSAAAHTPEVADAAVTQTQVESEDEVDYQPDLQVDPSRLH